MRMMRVMRLFGCLLGFWAAAPVAQSARAEQVDLLLVLAVDASGSVSQRRFDLQRDGYAAAFRNIQVLRAILSGQHQAIAVTMFQWTGASLQRPVVPWMIIKDEVTAEEVAKAIAATERQLYGGGTSISGAIDYGMGLFPKSPHEGERRVIDVSGDGTNNSGRFPAAARDDAVRQGVTINGLPILSVEAGLDSYFERFVIGGNGAFMISARSYETFADAIVKKLIAEIAGLPPGSARFAAVVKPEGLISLDAAGE